MLSRVKYFARPGLVAKGFALVSSEFAFETGITGRKYKLIKV